MKLTWDEFKVVTDFARYMASFTIFAFDPHFPVSFELFDDGKYARMTFGRNTDGLTDRIAFDLFFVPDEKRLRPKAGQRRRDFTIDEIKAAASRVYSRGLHVLPLCPVRIDDIAWPGIGPLGETKRAAFVEWAIEHGYLWPQSEGVTPEGVAYSADTGEELVWSTRVPRYASRVEAYPASARIAERYELRANPSVVVTMPLGAWLAMGWWMQRQPVPPKGPSNDMNVLDEPPSFSVGDAEYVGHTSHRMNPWYFIERVGVRTPSSWRPVLTHEGYTVYL